MKSFTCRVDIWLMLIPSLCLKELVRCLLENTKFNYYLSTTSVVLFLIDVNRNVIDLFMKSLIAQI